MKVAPQDIIWQPLFKRSGYQFFILHLAQEAYGDAMQSAVGWGYRDQLYLYTDDELESFYSKRDSASFKKFAANLSTESIKKILALIVAYSNELNKKTEESVIKLDHVRSSQEIIYILDTMYLAYRNLYSVYRFPTLIDQEVVENIDPSLLSECAEAKDISGHAFNFADRNFLPKLVKAVSLYTNIPTNLVLQLNYQELKDYLISTSKLTLNELEERSHFFILSMIDRKIVLRPGVEGKKFLKKISLPNQKINSNSVITGKPAYGGTVAGKVCVLNSLKSIIELPTNSILVMPMTTVGVISLLKNVIGIITDEGGVTCHAGIISREFKIPCITGTKIATKIFRDGDIVEINGDKGTVKKI